MPSRRDVVLDAAIEVLAEGGARGLAHRAVDTAAGLPSGSTSNLFRTRTALVAAVLARLSEREQVVLDVPPVLGEAELVGLAAAMVDDALGPGRAATLARRALFHEAARDPDVAGPLLDATRLWWGVVADLLVRVGVPAAEAPARGRLLLAYLDGVISDQLARPEDGFDAVRSLAPAVFGVVHRPTGR